MELHLLDHFGKPRAVHRLSEVTHAAQTIAIDLGLLFIRYGQNDHRQQRGPGIHPHQPEHFEPADFGEFQVRQHYA